MSRVNLADIFWCDEEDIPGIEQAIRNANHGTDKNLYDDLRELGEEGFQSMTFSPEYGYMVVEVKQGDICYSKGMWQEYKHGSYLPLHKDPADCYETNQKPLK